MQYYRLGRRLVEGAQIALGLAAFLLLVFGLPGTLAYWMASAGCAQRWERSGMASDYGFWQGCVVEASPGRWLPEASVKNVELK